MQCGSPLVETLLNADELLIEQLRFYLKGPLVKADTLTRSEVRFGVQRLYDLFGLDYVVGLVKLVLSLFRIQQVRLRVVVLHLHIRSEVVLASL